MSNQKTPLSITFGAETAILVVQGDDKIYDAALCTRLGIVRGIPSAATSIIQVTMAEAAKSTAASMLKATCTNGTGDDQETRTVPLICETSKVVGAKSSVEATTIIGQVLQLGGTVTKDWTIVRVK